MGHLSSTDLLRRWGSSPNWNGPSYQFSDNHGFWPYLSFWQAGFRYRPSIFCSLARRAQRYRCESYYHTNTTRRPQRRYLTIRDLRNRAIVCVSQSGNNGRFLPRARCVRAPWGRVGGRGSGRACGLNGDRRGDARVACESKGSPRSGPIAGFGSPDIVGFDVGMAAPTAVRDGRKSTEKIPPALRLTQRRHSSPVSF